VLLAGAPGLSLAGSEYQALYGETGGSLKPLNLTAEARLVEFLWHAAPLVSLTHDAAEGGLAVALAEAAIWSGVGAELDLDDGAEMLFGEGGGQVVIACPPEDVARLDGVPVRELGVVGGDRLLGSRLRDLGEAWHDRGQGN
jgi:phosphoribosylformylglycinamidine synthase